MNLARALVAALLGPAAAQRIEPAQLQVTLGALRPAPTGMVSDSPKLRAQANGFRGTWGELRFVYLGPTPREAHLASGEVRRQLGLKLLAQDGCNVLYVMWRLAPEPGLVVSVKSNPHQNRHAECGTRGYRNVRPSAARPVPPPALGSHHVLRAALEGTFLRVWIDGAEVWSGSVADEPLPFHGPVGLRADNARLAFELWGVPGSP